MPDDVADRVGVKDARHMWRAAEARAALEEASRFVGTDVAERRNLKRNFVAAYQMIQPG